MYVIKVQHKIVIVSTREWENFVRSLTAFLSLNICIFNWQQTSKDWDKTLCRYTFYIYNQCIVYASVLVNNFLGNRIKVKRMISFLLFFDYYLHAIGSNFYFLSTFQNKVSKVQTFNCYLHEIKRKEGACNLNGLCSGCLLNPVMYVEINVVK